MRSPPYRKATGRGRALERRQPSGGSLSRSSTRIWKPSPSSSGIRRAISSRPCPTVPASTPSFGVAWSSLITTPTTSGNWRSDARWQDCGRKAERISARHASRTARSLVCVPLRRGKVLTQVLRRAPRAVSGSITLDTPPLPQRARIHRVEAELIEQTSDRHLGPWIVPGDDQRAAILRASRLAIGGQGRGVDMVESLDDFRGRQMCLQELRGRRRLIVELRDVAITFGVIVVLVDHDLARQGLDRQ